MLTHIEAVGKEFCYPELESNHQDLIGLRERMYKQVFCKETRWVPPTPAANTQAELGKASLCNTEDKMLQVTGHMQK